MLIDIYRANPLLFILLSILAFTVLIQLCYYWIIFARVWYFKTKNDFNRKDEPVSIVISAHNEHRNLSANLPLIFAQDYENFEVVVVDHESDDDTHYLLRDFQNIYPNLKVVRIPEDVNFFYGKKFPLSIGIRCASNELLLLTDADCIPAGNQWLRKMASNFTDNKAIVLGYGAYKKGKGMLNRFVRFDTAFIAMKYLGFAISGMPYMGVGRNLAYRKSLFYRNGGFISHYRIPTGDDDLFINQTAKKKNIRVEFRPESHTVSEPKHSLGAWFRQKKRHLQSGVRYKVRHKFMLGFYDFTTLLYFALGAVLLALNYYPLITGGILALRFITQIAVFAGVMKRLNEKGFLLLVPFFEIFYLIISPFIFISGKFYRPNKWR